MNKMIRILALLAIFSVVTAGFAQPAPKILVIDMEKVLSKHYKAEKENAEIQEVAQKAQEQLNNLQKKIQTTSDQYKELDEQSRNALLKQEVRRKAEADSHKKMQEIQSISDDAQSFRMSMQQSLQQRIKNYRDILFKETAKIVKNIAVARGATFVFDKSGLSLIGIPNIVYSDPAYEITDDVLKEVNKGRSTAVAPTSATAPSTPSQPNVSNVTPETKRR